MPPHNSRDMTKQPEPQQPESVKAKKSFPSAQLKRCAHRARVPSTTGPFIEMMSRVLDAEAEKLVKRACAYKGSKRKTIGAKDFKSAYDGVVYGVREDRNAA